MILLFCQNTTLFPYFSMWFQPNQYRPPKGMILFSRQHQENKLTNKQEKELRQLTEDEVDLEASSCKPIKKVFFFLIP